jgi:predicted nucleotidyltransferase
LYEFLKEVRPDGPAIVFGSYAKSTETKKSDIDLLCVTTKNNVGKLAYEFKTKYALNIQVLTVKPSDFKNIKKDNLVLWNDLIEYGLILDGLDYYFKEVYKYD